MRSPTGMRFLAVAALAVACGRLRDAGASPPSEPQEIRYVGPDEVMTQVRERRGCPSRSRTGEWSPGGLGITLSARPSRIVGGRILEEGDQ